MVDRPVRYLYHLPLQRELTALNEQIGRRVHLLAGILSSLLSYGSTFDPSCPTAATALLMCGAALSLAAYLFYNPFSFRRLLRDLRLWRIPREVLRAVAIARRLD